MSSAITCLKSNMKESEKWHMRLGHINYQDLLKLLKIRVVYGLPALLEPTSNVCRLCQLRNNKGYHIKHPKT